MLQTTRSDSVTWIGNITWIGIVKWNVARVPLLAVARKLPASDSTIERLIANPITLPSALVVKSAEEI